MKNYSSNRAQKGKTAYRTPSLFKANKAIASAGRRVTGKSARVDERFQPQLPKGII